MYTELLNEKNSDPKLTELFDYLSKHTNQSVRSVLQVDFLYSTFLTQQEASLKLPEWTKNVFPNKMRTPFMLSLALLSYNETLQRLKIGMTLIFLLGIMLSLGRGWAATFANSTRGLMNLKK